MKVYEHSIQVHPEDIDEMEHINNVVYVRWVQEVAAAHWNHRATTTLKEKYAWVVLRHEIDYKNPGFLLDKIRGTTWVGAYNGARFDRYVKIITENKILAEAKTTWCLLNAKNLRPTRIPEDIIALL